MAALPKLRDPWEMLAISYPVLNWIIAYDLSQVHLLTNVCGNSLKLNGIVRGLMDDNCVLEFL